MAYASRGSRLRLPDRDDQLRTALVAGLLPDAVVRDKPLGTRRVRALRCYPESAVGHRTTFGGRNSRPLRDQSRALRRRRLLCAWPRDHRALDYTRNAASVGRRAHRARIVRLLRQHRARGLQQVAARAMALACLRGGHRRWLFRAIPLFADRGRVDGQNWLAGNAPDFCGRYAADFAAVSRPRDACNRDGIIGGCKANTVSATGIRRSIRPSQLYLARAWFLHLRFSACVHYGALALLFDRPWPVGGGRWLDARRDRNFQYRRLVELRLAQQSYAEALSALIHLLHSGSRDRRFHHAAGESVGNAGLRSRHRPHVALDSAADLGVGGGHVWYALAGDAFWFCLLQSSGRRFSWRAYRRHRLRAHRLV